jgi:hypothetical protein
MGKVGKAFALFLSLIIAMSCLTLLIQPAFAQTIPKPSIPEFSAKYVDHSFTVPARTYIDPYTGEQKTDPSYIVKNETIDITIKNQLFVSTEEIAYLCYNIREKGHFETNWIELYHITNGTNDNALIRASNSDHTIKSLLNPSSNGGQIDFQVKAYFTIGHRFSNTNFGTWIWEESDWSNTQTVTIGQFSTLTPSPTVPELSFLVILPLLLSVFSVSLVLRHRKTAKH